MKPKREIFEQLNRIRNIRSELETVRYNGLIMTRKQMLEMKSQICGICGGKKTNPKIYFGELFCGDCVEKSLAGK